MVEISDCRSHVQIRLSIRSCPRIRRNIVVEASPTVQCAGRDLTTGSNERVGGLKRHGRTAFGSYSASGFWLLGIEGIDERRRDGGVHRTRQASGRFGDAYWPAGFASTVGARFFRRSGGDEITRAEERQILQHPVNGFLSR